MATTRLYVETLVVGSIALLWVICLNFIIAAPSISDLEKVVSTIEPIVPLLIVPVIAFAYGIGWIVSFVSERLFKKNFQKKFRDDLFESKTLSYYDVKSTVLQRGSEKTLEDRLVDRHIIRISRCNTLNFLFLAMTNLPFAARGNYLLVPIILLFCLLSVGSFYQWHARYKSHYESMLSKYREIVPL